MTNEEILNKLAMNSDFEIWFTESKKVNVEKTLTPYGNWKQIAQNAYDQLDRKYFIKYHFNNTTDYNVLMQLVQKYLSHVGLFKNGEMKTHASFSQLDEVRFMNLDETDFRNLAKELIKVEDANQKE